MLTQHRLLMLSDQKPRMIVTMNPVMRRLEMNRPTRQIVVHCFRLQEPAAPKGSSNVGDPSTSFLDNISQDYDATQKTTEAVTAKLAEFVNKRFSAKLGDDKFKEKSEK